MAAPVKKFHERLLAVDDDPDFLSFLREALERPGLEFKATNDPEKAAGIFQQFRPQVVLSDMVMPRRSGMQVLQDILAIDPTVDVILLTGQYTAEAAVEAIEKGASDFIAKPVPVQILRERVDKLLDEARQRVRTSDLENQLLETHTFHGIIGRSPAIEDVFRRISRIAPHYQTALITGPSGSGKELVARAIRELSPVNSGPFVIVNCAAIVETLFESELFGHVKGSFTGATADKVGMFEAAHQGTLFLDEVEELSPSGQAKLLRVLQERQVQRVGATSFKSVDVRVIAATNRDLRKMVDEKKFREDLFYRLAMVELRMPTLADRPEDLDLLIQHFIRIYSERFSKEISGVSNAAHSALRRYPWPGNIRELENAIGNAIMMADKHVIDLANLPDDIASSSRGRPELVSTGQQFISDPNWTLEELERRFIEYVLDQENGNVPRAASRLGIPRSTLYSRLKVIKEGS